MCAQMTPDAIADAAEDIIKVWIKNPDFKTRDVPFEMYQGYFTELSSTLTKIKIKEEELTPLRNRRDDLKNLLSDLNTQVRSGIKGYFGADSTEYELVGGTRTSERKKAGPRKKTVATATTK